MSDSSFNDDFQVDPRLDALLSRTLGRGSVPRQQRQRHFERLGLVPRLGGSAGTWRAPVVVGRPPSALTPHPETLPARRRRRQWLELGAAALAIILVGALLVALFRDRSGGEDHQQLAASPEATIAPATATPREQLYVVSHVASTAQDVVLTEGRVSAIDPETGEEFWSVEAGPRIDAVLSPDGQHLFVADSQRDGDFIYALDTQTGRELWRQPIENRQWMKPATGQSMLSVSPDGGTLSVYTCEGCTGEIRSNTGRNWLARFNALTGNRLDDLEITACRGTTILGPESAVSRPLYVICDTTLRLDIIDLATGQPLTLTYDERLEGGFPETTGINASVVSPDGRFLYLAGGDRLTVIDMTRHSAQRVQLAEEVNVERRLPLLALSPDGARLYIGSLDTAAFDQGRAEANRVDVYDTATWEPLGQIAASYPLNGQAFDAALDRDAIYGAFVSYPEADDNAVESRILRLTFDSDPETIATRTNEEVLYLFAGTVEVDPDVEPLPTPTLEPTAHERLFAVSNFTQPGQGMDGRVSAYDAVSGELIYRIDTDINPDAVLSPDGARLYIVTGGIISSGGTSQTTLRAVEAVNGDEVWSVAIEHRLPWAREEGPTTLAVSYDGSRLFILGAGEASDNIIHVYDTSDGALVATIDGVTGCTAQLSPSADGRTLYVACMASQFPLQVIDLETMTRVGVMQGFGGIITGAAVSPDGRWLYIPQDFDSELSLSVIDMNGRAVSGMRSIVHMDRDPLHSLNITAVSPDGSRLFIGFGTESEGAEPVATEVWVWDTEALDRDPQQLAAPDAINGWSLAPAPDNNSVFAIHNEDGPDPGGQPSTEAAIMRIAAEDGSDAFVRHWGGRVVRVFSGRVTDTSETQTTDEPGSSLRDLEIPENLPLGLTFSHHVSRGTNSDSLVFTGDDGRVIDINVRSWEDGDVLDPPERSGPVHLGSLTIYVTADPEGGWPRNALWHDTRFKYDLTVLSGPIEGWTLDDLLAIVTAFSSPASARVCPAVSWVGPENRNVDGLPEAYWIDGDGLALGDADGRLVEGQNDVTWVIQSVGIVDPDPNVVVTLRGTRLSTSYGRSVPLELSDYTIEYNAVIEDGDADVEHYVRASVVFPTAGCWQIEAEFGGQFLMAIVHVEPDTTPELDEVWDILRWRPLRELGIDPSPPCLRVPGQHIITGVGLLVGDVEANGGPVYLNGPDEEGALRVPSGPVEEGGYYAQVTFVTSGDYTGPLLVRPVDGSAPIGFSTAAPGPAPASEWRLQDPANNTSMAGYRQWNVFLRFSGPGCHALQIDGLDFSSIIAFEVLTEDDNTGVTT